MYEVPRDYLITYDPEYTENHYDSSEFEESYIPILAPKNGKHNIVKQHKQRRNKSKNYQLLNQHSDLYIDCDEYPVKLKNETKGCTADIKPKQVVKDKENSEQKQRLNKKPKCLYSGDQAETSRSKISLLKHKIIPCLSSIFKRYNNTKQVSVIEENHVENKRRDSGCQHCSDCERRRIRKLYKRQNYAVQPVYAIQGDAHKVPDPFASTDIKDKMLQKRNRKKSKNQYSGCSFFSSSESESQSKQERQHNFKEFRKMLKTEIMKEHLKYHQNEQVRNQHLQYTSKNKRSSYQVFTTPFQSRTNFSPESEGMSQECKHYVSKMQTSSSFWDYLFDKMSRKHQIQRLEMPRPCQCSSTQTPYLPSNSKNYEDKPEPSRCKGRHQSTTSNGCSCKPESKEHTIATSCSHKNCESFDSVSKETSLMSLKNKMQDKGVQCICDDETTHNKRTNDKTKQKQAPDSLKYKKFSSRALDSKLCQDDHDEITESLKKTYNGEILCIHNPPCILINGCLNLPPPKDAAQLSLWPVTGDKKSFFNRKKKSSRAHCEQACQYHAPFVDVQQCETTKSTFNCQTPELPHSRSEKLIQSICNHDPPCEVVRGCYKPKYDPKLQNTCVHVPMCEKFPRCKMGENMKGRTSCEHRPRCPEMPLCSRNYMVYSARGTEVKPRSSFVCRHHPPCIMIPKCLCRAACDYVPIEAIPDCIHQPLCEMVPACCRKTAKGMVSASSQYPNSCRIV